MAARAAAATLSAVVAFAVIPEAPRAMPNIEALVSAQADPPEFAVMEAKCPTYPATSRMSAQGAWGASMPS